VSGAAAVSRLAGLAEAGLLPDALVRFGIRRMLAERLREVAARSPAAQQAFLAACRQSAIALVPELANEQHYEVPPEFFERVLGPHLKYSCCLWDANVTTLAEAEDLMLAQSCERADVRDGMAVLDLGCGWGSFSLYVAARLPACRVLAVSNSKPQREFILARAAQRGLANLTVVTADVNHFEAPERFDRVISIEMFEHVRNHEALLARIATWLAPEGRLFVHHFCHREHAYPYEDAGTSDWMARHFFSGGMMPSEDWLQLFERDLAQVNRWRVGGMHYARTSEAWLANLDAQRSRLRPLFAATYGEHDAQRWIQRWRLFFLACAELFAHRGGGEWFITQQLLAPAGR
jgi:cyclopropane-fatty-acyl-phospholipid synthase